MPDDMDTRSPVPEREGQTHVRVLQDRLGFRESLPFFPEGRERRARILRDHPTIKWASFGIGAAPTPLAFVTLSPWVAAAVSVGWAGLSVWVFPTWLNQLVQSLAVYVSRARKYVGRLRSRVRQKLARRPAIRLLGESPGVVCSDCSAPIRHRGGPCRACGSRNPSFGGQLHAPLRLLTKTQRLLAWASFLVGVPFLFFAWPLALGLLLVFLWLNLSDPARLRQLSAEVRELLAWLLCRR